MRIVRYLVGACVLGALGCGAASLSRDASPDGAGGARGGNGGSAGNSGAAGQAGSGAGGVSGSGGSSATAGTGGTSGSGGSSATAGTGGGSAGRGGTGPAGASGGGGAGRGGTGGTGGAGGASGGGGAAGRGGTGAAGASGGGATGAGGAGGTAACTNTDSDKLNCGVCGHSCLGGDCAAGICQPFLLGTIPSMFDYARQTVVTGGKVYVFTQVGQGSAGNAWQFDANTPSTPVEVMTGGSLGCVMGGTLFWLGYTSPNYLINSCTFSSCTATTKTIVTVGTDGVFPYPGCDATNNEIIWVTTPSSGSGYTIHRASATGTNARTITSFNFPNDGASWSIADSGLFAGGPDKFFYYMNSDATGKASLYYISTTTVNAAGVSVATVNGQIFGGSAQSVLANGSIVLANAYTPAQVYQTVSAPLPNGVISGTPPTFMAGNIFGGVIDQTTFYGSVSGATVPTDAVVKCPLSNCSSPTIIARGQGYANYFAVDATAIYWTTSGQVSTALWKAAK